MLGNCYSLQKMWYRSLQSPNHQLYHGTIHQFASAYQISGLLHSYSSWVNCLAKHCDPLNFLYVIGWHRPASWQPFINNTIRWYHLLISHWPLFSPICDIIILLKYQPGNTPRKVYSVILNQQLWLSLIFLISSVH